MEWLPRPPADFSRRAKALLDAEGAIGHPLRALANHFLDENQLLRLAGTLSKARQSGRSLRPLDPFRLALLSNATTDFLAPSIEGSALRHGLALQVLRGSYGQVLQDALATDSPIYAERPDAVLIATDHRWYPMRACPGDPEQAAAVVDACAAQLQAVRDAVRANAGAVCILQTLAPPPEGLFGSLDRGLPGTLLHLINELNRSLRQIVEGTEDVVLDAAAVAQSVGLADWHDVSAWNLAKIPFSHQFLPLYADHVARLLASLRGKGRRCLILDLDNTVWGGVIGDDGIEGIKIAQGDAVGEAFLDVQRAALDLRSRGIVLAVCSKNDDAIARRPFLEHPDMLLKLDHLAVFQANWNDKGSNIQAIAEELALGLESVVFLDDNPVERDFVRRTLPAVAVPELPADPALYARTLLAAGYFESVHFSSEDLTRADFYTQNSRRIEVQKKVGDLDSYLTSLNMEITFQPFDETGRSRIAQLINKSNQYNLTTHRYTEVDVAAMQIDPSCLTLQVRLMDALGDNGMISVVIGRCVGDDTLDLDTWLMSCRVLGRKVEHTVLQFLLEVAAERGIRRIIGQYIPTERNGLVRDHYSKLGFRQSADLDGNGSVWELDVAIAPKMDPIMVVHSKGFGQSAMSKA
jgi:FkbH-like protein